MEALHSATASTPEFSLAEKTLPAKVVSVYDGDTLYAVLPLGSQLWKFNCRLSGYDTPEMKPPKTKPNRDIEKARALKSKQALMSHICSGVDMEKTYTNQELDAIVGKNDTLITLICHEFDKYGRLLVEVPMREGNTTVNQWMIDKGYGYKYEGGTKDANFAVV
jgi:endonuclease YncB( thermonuclease family)